MHPSPHARAALAPLLVLLASCGGASEPKCQGEVISCGKIEKSSQCEDQFPCYWQPDKCDGYTIDCHVLDKSESTCTEVGCNWNPTQGCYGLTHCGKMKTEAHCKIPQFFCNWSPGDCRGVSPSTCEELDEDTCGKTMSCEWK